MDITDLPKLDKLIAKIVKNVLDDESLENAKQLISKCREFVIGLETKVDQETRDYYETRIELILKAVINQGVT